MKKVISTHLTASKGTLSIVYIYSNGEIKVKLLSSVQAEDVIIDKPVTTGDGDFY